MNLAMLAKAGKAVGTVAGATSVPGMLVKVGVSLAVSVATDIAAKKLAEKLSESRAAYTA